MEREKSSHLEELNERLETRVSSLQAYIDKIEPLILEAPLTRPRPNSREMENLVFSYERVMKILATVMETQRKLLLMKKEEEDRRGLEHDELYYYLKSLGSEDFDSLRDWMKMRIKGKVDNVEWPKSLS